LTSNSLNPSLKLLYVTYIVALASYFKTPQQLLYLLAFSIILSLASGAGVKKLLTVLAGVSPMAFGLGWFNALVAGDAVMLTIVAFRILTVAAVTFYFVATTDPSTFFYSLIQNLRLPYRLSIPLSMAYLLLRDMLAWYVETTHGLKGRWLIKTVWDTVFKLKTIAVMLLNYVSTRVDLLAEALELRCFNPGRRPWRKVSVTSDDIIIFTLIVAASGLSLLLTA